MHSIMDWLTAGLAICTGIAVGSCSSAATSPPPSSIVANGGVGANGGAAFNISNGGCGGTAGATGTVDAGGILCGNSIVNAGENCDDGNSWSGDGCSGAC